MLKYATTTFRSQPGSCYIPNQNSVKINASIEYNPKIKIAMNCNNDTYLFINYLSKQMQLK